jgi:hypothetical protein
MGKTKLLKSLKVTEDTHNELKKLGVYGENMDDIIAKCIDAYKKMNKNR